MTTKIVKSTERGQITLPITWRNKFANQNYLMEIDERQIIIKPFQLKIKKEEVIFDADNDNEGKGIAVEEMIKMLKKLNK